MNYIAFTTSCGTSDIVSLPEMINELIKKHGPQYQCIFMQIKTINAPDEYHVAILGFTKMW